MRWHSDGMSSGLEHVLTALPPTHEQVQAAKAVVEMRLTIAPSSIARIVSPSPVP